MLQYFDLFHPVISVRCETECNDAEVRTECRNNAMCVYLTAHRSKPCFVEFEWKTKIDPSLLALGDAWERSYGELGFTAAGNCDRALPWYFMLTDKENCFCFGVKTHPSAFISFRVSENGITALADCRNGGMGTALNGRELPLCTFIYKIYEKTDAFSALCDFCKALCPAPILPQAPIYGGNDWYNAYGHNSYETVCSAARINAECAKGIANAPFMVIDDGWEQGSTAGPWLPNHKFGDMRAICNEIKNRGLRPGIWIRPLNTNDPAVNDDLKILRNGKREYLDPTHPEVQALIREDVTRIKDWGYALLKHDYTTFDLFGDWGKDFADAVPKTEGWHFYDQTKTNAEIVLELYRLIREAADGMLIIGCNTFSHLCAGLVEINRTGDDTSGKDWNRTVKMGVNTLAFRLAQNGAFYLVDADCVGMPKGFIPWEKNRQWLELLAASGTALFVSLDEVTDAQKKEIAAAYQTAQTKHTIKPVDWFNSITPSVWQIDGKQITFQWN